MNYWIYIYIKKKKKHFACLWTTRWTKKKVKWNLEKLKKKNYNKKIKFFSDLQKKKKSRFFEKITIISNFPIKIVSFSRHGNAETTFLYLGTHQDSGVIGMSHGSKEKWHWMLCMKMNVLMKFLKKLVKFSQFTTILKLRKLFLFWKWQKFSKFLKIDDLMEKIICVYIFT